jgi:hypothetical protein
MGGLSVVVMDIRESVESFKSLYPGGFSFEATYSRAWHFNFSYKNRKLDFGGDSGIYIYSKPAEPDWDLPLHKNSEAIWYIGKSQGTIAGRVWAHMRLIFEPGTGEVCNPRFKYHDWANDPSVPGDICTAVATGNIVVYTIQITPSTFDPQVIEKYLLACFYKSIGTLPPLNKEI